MIFKYTNRFLFYKENGLCIFLFSSSFIIQVRKSIVKHYLTFFRKSLRIGLAEGWQSGNAPDSKSGEPANTGTQVQILYLP